MNGQWSLRRGFGLIFILVSFVALALPVFLYWLLVGRAPSVSVAEAKRQLEAGRHRALLIDIRPRATFSDEHVAAAESWPWKEIREIRSSREMPGRFRGKRLFLLCENGILSATAALRMRSVGIREVYSIRDGMCGWIASRAKSDGAGDSAFRLIHLATRRSEPTERASPRLEQYAAVLSGFAIKPLYMLLALALIIWLWRWAVSPDLVALRWALIAFLAGEVSCAINYLLFGHQSHLGEYLHSSGMVVSIALAAYAGLEAVDLRLIHFSDKDRPCALDLCAPCAKYADAACGLRRVLILSVASAMIMALVPFFFEPRMACYNTRIFGTPYTYAHPVIYQMFETRVCPAYALLLLGTALVALLLQKQVQAKPATILFAAGIGPLWFGLSRLFLFASFQDHLVWSVFWEEAVELLSVLGAACLLWIFRARLFAPESHVAPSSRMLT